MQVAIEIEKAMANTIMRLYADNDNSEFDNLYEQLQNGKSENIAMIFDWLKSHPEKQKDAVNSACAVELAMFEAPDFVRKNACSPSFLRELEELKEKTPSLVFRMFELLVLGMVYE